MEQISWSEFEKVELRIGRIIDVADFPEALKPAYKLLVDFGKEIGVRKSSAQITALYTKEELMGKTIIGVINFPPKQIGPIISQCLITGFHNDEGNILLAVPDKNVPLGSKLC
jgi:tRNA-binding protein